MWKLLAGRRGRRELAERLLGIELPTESATGARLQWMAQQLERMTIDWRLLTSHVRFHRDHYQRRSIYRGRDWELLVCAWLPGQGSVVHGHGGSSGVTLVLSGELSETRYQADDGKLTVTGIRRVKQGETLVEEAETIHRVINVGREPAVSLHLYSPPMKVMQRYEEPRHAPAETGRKGWAWILPRPAIALRAP